MLHDYELGVGPRDNGVFFLAGGESDGDPHCYMASGHDLPARIVARDVESRRWQTAYYAISGFTPWTQTEAGYIGSHCAAKASEGGNYALDGPATGIRSTPSPELAVRSAELAKVIALLMTVLGCGVLGGATVADKGLFYLRTRQSNARGRIAPDGSVTVLAGSSGLEEVTSSAPKSVIAYRDQMVQSGTARLGGGRFEMTVDQTFSSLSYAAAMIVGQSVNGHELWKTADGLSARQAGALIEPKAA
jgi:hypothetical protein